jgi:hypothetical protein
VSGVPADAKSRNSSVVEAFEIVCLKCLGWKLLISMFSSTILTLILK